MHRNQNQSSAQAASLVEQVRASIEKEYFSDEGLEELGVKIMARMRSSNMIPFDAEEIKSLRSVAGAWSIARGATIALCIGVFSLLTWGFNTNYKIAQLVDSQKSTQEAIGEMKAASKKTSDSSFVNSQNTERIITEIKNLDRRRTYQPQHPIDPDNAP